MSFDIRSASVIMLIVDAMTRDETNEETTMLSNANKETIRRATLAHAARHPERSAKLIVEDLVAAWAQNAALNESMLVAASKCARQALKNR